MKKVILFALAFVLTSALANAQQLAIGVKGGLNFATLNGGSASSLYDSRTGYHIGAFTLIKLSKIGIQPEILFSKQGANYSFDGSNFKSDYSYVNIPILLKLYLIGGLNLQAGPQFGFLTSAKVNGDDVKDQLKKSDLSAALGAGWDLPFGLTVDARYNLGLSKIASDSDAPKNQVFQLSVGFKLIKIGG